MNDKWVLEGMEDRIITLENSVKALLRILLAEGIVPTHCISCSTCLYQWQSGEDDPCSSCDMDNGVIEWKGGV